MRTVDATQCIRGGRVGGAVVHFTLKGTENALCGRYAIPGRNTGMRPCRSCVRIGSLVLDMGKGEGCPYPDTLALSMLHSIAAGLPERQARAVRMIPDSISRLNAEFYAATRVELAKRAKINPAVARAESLNAARDWAHAVLIMNAFARGEIKPVPKPEPKVPALIMNTAVTEAEEIANGGPVIERAKPRGGDGMIDPKNAKPARCILTDNQRNALTKMGAFENSLIKEIRELEGKECPELSSTDLDTLTTRKAVDALFKSLSASIEKLKTRRDELKWQARKTVAPVVAESMRKGGVYELNGELYRYAIAQRSGYAYALKWTGEAWDYEAGKGMVRKLTPEMAISAERASEWGHVHHCCVFCSRPLNDQRSEDAGYGSTCADNYGLPWG